MPFKDPEARRAYQRAYMERRRAESSASWESPEKAAAKDARWYAERGGKPLRREAKREERTRKRQQGLIDFTRKLNHE